MDLPSVKTIRLTRMDRGLLMLIGRRGGVENQWRGGNCLRSWFCNLYVENVMDMVGKLLIFQIRSYWTFFTSKIETERKEAKLAWER